MSTDSAPAPRSASSDIPTSPSGRTRPVFGLDSAVNSRPIDVNLRHCPVVAARGTLITAITERIAQKRLTQPRRPRR